MRQTLFPSTISPLSSFLCYDYPLIGMKFIGISFRRQKRRELFNEGFILRRLIDLYASNIARLKSGVAQKLCHLGT